MLNRITISILLALVCIYATLIEPQWIEITILDMRVDKNFDGIRVVQLSDLHIQKIGTREINILDKVKSLNPDLVVLSGDVIDKADKLSFIHIFLETLANVRGIAVLGNWEYWSEVDLQELRKEYQDHNIRLLVNEVTSYQIRQRVVNVLGIDDYTAGQPNYEFLDYSDNNDTTILVQHSPGYFDNQTLNKNTKLLDLCLAGHTHGGQTTFFGLPIWKPPGSGSFSSGIYSTNLCDLFVSKGIGTSILPIRFWARPEIAVFDL